MRMLTSAVDVTTVLGSLALFGTAVAGGLWWLWQRAKKAAETGHRLAQLEAALAESDVERQALRDRVESLEEEFIWIQARVIQRQAKASLPSTREPRL